MTEELSEVKSGWKIRKEISIGNLMVGATFLIAMISWGITQEHQNRSQDAAIERLRLEVAKDKQGRQEFETRMTRVETVLDVKLTNLTAAIETQSKRIDRVWDVLNDIRAGRRKSP